MGRTKVQKHKATREEVAEAPATLDVTELPATVETPDNSQLGEEKTTEMDIKVTPVTPIETEDLTEVEEVPKEQVTVLSDRAFEKGGRVYNYPSKSQMFIELHLHGYTVGEIAKVTQSHYSFVYGVIDKHIGVTRQPKTSKADLVRVMAARGMTPGQIAKELNSNYSYIHSIVKKFRDMQEVSNG